MSLSGLSSSASNTCSAVISYWRAVTHWPAAALRARLQALVTLLRIDLGSTIMRAILREDRPASPHSPEDQLGSRRPFLCRSCWDGAALSFSLGSRSLALS